MFLALEASRLHKTLHKRDFSRMMQKAREPDAVRLTNRGRPQTVPNLRACVAELLEATGIDPTLPDYSVEEHLPLVRDFYNQRWPGMYRIAAFTQFGTYRPVFKGEPAVHDVCIYQSNGHFDGVRNLAKIFGKDNYCIDCETPYHRRQKHTIECVRRCGSCARMGPDFPCTPDAPPYYKLCSDCGKHFTNQS